MRGDYLEVRQMPFPPCRSGFQRQVYPSSRAQVLNQDIQTGRR